MVFRAMVCPDSGSLALYTQPEGDFASSLRISKRPILLDISLCLCRRFPVRSLFRRADVRPMGAGHSKHSAGSKVPSSYESKADRAGWTVREAEGKSQFEVTCLEQRGAANRPSISPAGLSAKVSKKLTRGRNS